MSDGTWTYTWEHGRQLAAMSRSGQSISYTYGSDGLRIGKTVTGTDAGTTKYYYNDGKLVYMSFSGGYMHFRYDANGAPVYVYYSPDNTIYYYLSNAQGDITGLVSRDGTIVAEYRYDAWGKLLAVTGSMAGTLGARNPLRYRGYVYDEETGLYYVSSRYYDPEICRFINADEVSLLGANGDIQSYNLYAYCGNNPVARKDASGYVWGTALIGAAIGGIISGGLEIASQLSRGIKLNEVDWKDVGIATGTGAISGAIASSGIGLIGQVAANAGLGAGEYVVSSAVKGRNINCRDMAINTFAGAVSGLIGGKGANGDALRSTWNAAQKGIRKEVRRNSYKYSAKTIARYAAVKQTVKRSVAWSIARYTAGTIISRRLTE